MNNISGSIFCKIPLYTTRSILPNLDIYIYMIFSVRYSSTRVMRFWARIRPASFALLNIYTFWDLIARVLIILQFLLGLPTYHNSFLPLLYLSSCSVVHPKWLHFCSAIAAIHMPGRLRAMSRNGFGKLSICSVSVISRYRYLILRTWGGMGSHWTMIFTAFTVVTPLCCNFWGTWPFR